MTDIASHRGGALLWPENSRIAFENTAKLPVEQVEFDVHPTRDGKLVVIHDDTLDRTTDGKGPVAARDWAELSKLVLKGTGGQRMLLLDEVIEIFRPTPIVLRLEIKCGPDRVPYPGHAARVAGGARAGEGAGTQRPHQLPARHGARGGRRRRGRCARLAGAAAGPDRHRPRQRDRHGKGSGRADARPAPEHAERRHRRRRCATAGLGIGGWACNDAEAIARLLALEVDVFTTDRPDLAIAQRQALRKG